MCRTVYPLSMTIILDIIHRLSVSEHNVSETGSVSFFRYKSGGRENIYVFIFICFHTYLPLMTSGVNKIYTMVRPSLLYWSRIDLSEGPNWVTTPPPLPIPENWNIPTFRNVVFDDQRSSITVTFIVTHHHQKHQNSIYPFLLHPVYCVSYKCIYIN